jgi:hypothetical protein
MLEKENVKLLWERMDSAAAGGFLSIFAAYE